MKNFLKTTLAFVLGILISIFIVILCIFISLKISTGFSNYVPKNNSILLLEMKGKMYEDAPPKTIFERKNKKLAVKIHQKLKCIYKNLYLMYLIFQTDYKQIMNKLSIQVLVITWIILSIIFSISILFISIYL